MDISVTATKFMSSSIHDESAMMSNLNLKQQVMLSQFMSITGTNLEQSIQILQSTNWQYQTALSLFFGDISLNKSCPNQSPICPCSTPVTPPNMEFMEKAFSKLGSTQSSSSLNSNVNTQNTANQATMPIQMAKNNKFF